MESFFFHNKKYTIRELDCVLTKRTFDAIDSRPISLSAKLIFGLSSIGDRSSDFLADCRKHGFCGKTGGGGFGGFELSCSIFVCNKKTKQCYRYLSI